MGKQRMIRFGVSIFLFVFSISGLFAGDKVAGQLFFTGDLYGYLKPCG